MIRDLPRATVSQQLAYGDGFKEGLRRTTQICPTRHRGPHTEKYWRMGYDDGWQTQHDARNLTKSRAS